MRFFVTPLLQFLRYASLSCLAVVALQSPLKAAENIFFTYGPIKLTVRVESLETFVATGEVDRNLKFLFDLLGTSQEEKDKIREFMQFKPDVDPLVVSRFFNSSLGEDLLERIGVALNIPMEINGKYAIRAALIEAALDPQEGLTLMNFIRKYPTDMHFPGEVIENRAKAVELVVKASEHFIAEMAILAAAEAQTEPPVQFDQPGEVDPTKPGPYGIAPKQTWNLVDESRDRRFYVDIYRPQRWRTGKTPVVIVSHGLASRPEDYDQIGKAMASYGFLVAMPQHPGSDYLQAQALLEGESRISYHVTDFIDRPKDISYVIDELERRNPSEFDGRLNLTEVGVGGHSFGGYTALAVGGATFDWEYLKKECNIGLGVPDTSLLLQCDALNLPEEDYQFRDPRVKAIATANPFNSAVFGITGLQEVTVPVIMMGGSYDPATPFVLEQARSFPWLGSQEKYLSLAEGQAHVDFSKLDANITNTINSMDDLTLPSPNLLHSYGASLVMPFFSVHIAKDERFLPYLEAVSSYTEYLSRDQEFKFYVITEKSIPALVKDIQQFRRDNDIPPPSQPYPSQAE